MRRLLVAMLIASTMTVVVRGQVPCSVVESQPDCEVAFLPGPQRDTLELVAIDGTQVFATDGELRLTTVGIDDTFGFLDWLQYRFSDSVDLVDRELIYPSGTSEDEVADRNAQLMRVSQSSAILAALTHAGYELGDVVDGVRIVEIAADPAAGAEDLAVDDRVRRVGDVAVSTASEVVDAVGQYAPGDTIRLTVEREGRTLTVDLVARAHPEDPDRALVGVLLEDVIDLPFDVEIDAGEIGGPSAGLMFALGIVELLDEEDLTGDRIVAGTGTITMSGEVGAIGGIRQKVTAASTPHPDEPPASVFLAPAGNFAEARAAHVNSEILIVPVATLGEAVAALRSLRDGQQPAGAVALGA